VRLDAGYNFAVTAGGKTTYEKLTMEKYWWQTERLEPEPPSIVSCNRDILNDMLGSGNAETTGADNFETVRLVWAGYESAKTGKAIDMDTF
jgi:predicted dehydrogenase